ncbi:hypothetical protein M9Y10_002496 [Tritrichomonas musculus]|uniref:Nucleoplasmin-like domain-containing protein n=1 Tax=Tritrichomonas musculus TaxID=1915356 RepID=A0ABR2L9Z2_9EUKA
MSQESFWSMKIAPGQVCKIDLPEATELKLTNACIVPNTPTLPIKGISFQSNPMFQPPSTLIRLYIQTGNYATNNDMILLGTFIPGKIEHQILQFTIRQNRFVYISLHNVSSGSEGEVIHICGKLSTINDNSEVSEYEEEEENSNQDNDQTDSNDNNNSNHQHKFDFSEPSVLRAFGL